MAKNTLADPQFRRERATKAAKARTSIDYHVRKVVENAPKLTDEHVEKLRQLLPAVES